jgi:hypothetical protein
MALKVVVAVVAELLAAFFANFSRFNVVVSGAIFHVAFLAFFNLKYAFGIRRQIKMLLRGMCITISLFSVQDAI